MIIFCVDVFIFEKFTESNVLGECLFIFAVINI